MFLVKLMTRFEILFQHLLVKMFKKKIHNVKFLITFCELRSLVNY